MNREILELNTKGAKKMTARELVEKHIKDNDKVKILLSELDQLRAIQIECAEAEKALLAELAEYEKKLGYKIVYML